MGLTVDALTYFLILVGNDEELHRTASGVHHLVDTESRHVEHHVAVDHLLPVFQHQIRRGDDDHVTDEDHASEGDVTVFVDDGRDDIRTTRGTVRSQSKTYARAAEHGTDDGSHERLVVEQVPVIIGIDKRRGSRQHDDGVDGLHAELPAQNPQGRHQKHGIDTKIGPLYGNAHTPVDD